MVIENIAPISELLAALLSRILYPIGTPHSALDSFVGRYPVAPVDTFLGPFLCLAVYFIARALLNKVPLKSAAVLSTSGSRDTVILDIGKKKVLNLLHWLLDLRITLHLIRYLCNSIYMYRLFTINDIGGNFVVCIIATVICVIWILLMANSTDFTSSFIGSSLSAFGILTVVDLFAFSDVDMGGGVPGWPFWAIPVLLTVPGLSGRTFVEFIRYLVPTWLFRKDTYWTERMRDDHYVEHWLTVEEANALTHALAFAVGQKPDLGQQWTISMTNDQYIGHLRELSGKIGRKKMELCLPFQGEERPLMLHTFQPEAVRQTYAALGLQREPSPKDHERMLGAVNAYGDYLAKTIWPEQQALEEAYQTECQIIGRGQRGETRVFRAVDELKKRVPTLRTLENFRVQYSGGSAETDLLIVCQQGVFCLEIKNYNEDGEGNYQLVVHPDGSWYKLYGNQQLYPIEGSPFAQNAIHATAIQEAFAAPLREAAPGVTDLRALVRPAVVLGSDVPVINQSAYPLLHPETIYSYIAQFPAVFTPEQVDRLWQAMSAKSLEALPFRHPDLEGRQKRLDELQAELETLMVLQKEFRLSEKYRVFDTEPA